MFSKNFQLLDIDCLQSSKFQCIVNYYRKIREKRHPYFRRENDNPKTDNEVSVGSSRFQTSLNHLMILKFGSADYSKHLSCLHKFKVVQLDCRPLLLCSLDASSTVPYIFFYI